MASGKGFEDCIEMIDIGGPTMIRAAAKNCKSVAVVTNPASYPQIIAALKNGGLTMEHRRDLARQVTFIIVIN